MTAPPIPACIRSSASSASKIGRKLVAPARRFFSRVITILPGDGSFDLIGMPVGLAHSDLLATPFVSVKTVEHRERGKIEQASLIHLSLRSKP
jgi:hypothetical protein